MGHGKPCDKKRGFLSYVVPVIVCLAIGVFLDVFVINIAHWETARLAGREYDVDVPDGTTVESHDGEDDSDVSRLSLIVDNDIDSVTIIPGRMTSNATITLSISDAGHSRSEYELPSFSVIRSDVSKTVPLHAYGDVRTLSVSVTTDDGSSFPIRGITLNRQVPLDIRWWVILGIFLFSYACWVLRPSGLLWKMRVSDWDWTVRAVLCVLAVLVLGLTHLTFFYADDDLTSNVSYYHSNALDEYAELARSLSRGETWLSQEPPSWLSEMTQPDDASHTHSHDNVLDTTARNAHRKATGERSKWDTVYHDGRYYVYFGVVPVILAYLPYYLLTGSDLLSSWVVAGSVFLFEVASLLVLVRLARSSFKDASLGKLCVCYIAFMLVSGIVYACGRPNLYNVPVTSGLALGMLGVWFLSRAVTLDGMRPASLFLGGACCAAVMGCRPTLAPICLAVPLASYLLIRRKPVSTGTRVGSMALLWSPVVLIAVLLMAYNYVRFDSPFDFGATYNLTTNDMTLRGRYVSRAIEGVLYYLMAFPKVDARFPFVHSFTPEPQFSGMTIYEPEFGGLLVLCPFLLVCAWYLVRNARERGTSWWLVLISVSLGVAISVMDTEVAGLLARYQQDFGYLFGVAFILTMFGTDDDGIMLLSFLLVIVSCLLVISIRLGMTDQSSYPTGPLKASDWYWWMRRALSPAS